MDDESRILVISGPSGSGKSTIVNRLVVESPVRLEKMISATTRPARPSERDGEDYYFLTLDEFNRRRDAEEFVECEEVFSAGYWYGTLKSELRRAQEMGAWAFLEIDVKGATRVLQVYPGALSIFIRTPSDDVFEQRLRSRGTESEDVIQRRLKSAREELQYADRYQYQICNDNLDQAVATIIEILVNRESRNA